MFPRVALEVRRRRALAARIPDPALRRLALHALHHKGPNLEGAAAFATLVSGVRRPDVVKALVACQTICDYLDVLCEQPSEDPVANGYALHNSLLTAIAPTSSQRARRPSRDYYRHHHQCEDGGYLRALVENVRDVLTALPSHNTVAESMTRAAERIVTYQALNHGDASGSYEPFKRWAASENRTCEGLRWWETGAGAGSTLGLHVLIAAAANPRLARDEVMAIEDAYFPWIGALHSLLDSLVDRAEDIHDGERGLIDCYPSVDDAAKRMGLIAGEALHRARALPEGEIHTMIVAAMTSFYVCELGHPTSQHAKLVVPAVLEAIGHITRPSLAILGARRSFRRTSIARCQTRRTLVEPAT